jgi:hypothetical protein
MFKNCVVIISAILFTGCNAIPDISKSLEDIMTDGVVLIQIDKEAFKEKTDTILSVEIIHKD